MNDLIMFDLMFYTRRLFLLSIITIMIYQLIDVTVNYLQYPTLIKSDLTYFQSGDLPSLTLCPSYYHWDFAFKTLYIDIIEGRVEFHYYFNYNMQQKSHTNNSVKQTWTIWLVLKPN